MTNETYFEGTLPSHRRERDLLIELLQADRGNRVVDDLDLDSFTMAWGFNANSGNVWLSDEDLNCVMLNSDDKLENWLNCSNCSHEGFKSEMPLNDNQECKDCEDKN